MAQNIIWLRTGEKLENLIPDPVFREKIKNIFLELYNDLTLDFQGIVGEIDSQCDFLPGTAMQIFKSLIVNHDIQIDLSRKINIRDPRVLPYLNI